jgi:hypothetical protein
VLNLHKTVISPESLHSTKRVGVGQISPVEVADIENLLADVIFPAVLSLPDLHAVISLRWKSVHAGGEDRAAWIVRINTVARQLQQFIS